VNRVDRLFAVLLLLQGRRRVRARDIAARLEVSERTVYRDVAALAEAGVPVVALPGAGYELAEGFYLPPLVFTPAEAAALSLGARLLAAQAAGRLPQDAQRALEKIAAVLPEAARREVERLTGVIAFLSRRQPFDLDDPLLRELQAAIVERRVVHLRYHAFSTGEVSEREVEPLRLHYAGGAWYLNAYCRARGGVRDFRLERIDEAQVLPATFAPRDVAQGPSSRAGAAAPAPERLTVVRVRFAPEVVRWVREWQPQGFVAEEPSEADGSVVMRYGVEAPLELRPWLFSWGAAAEALEPAVLREAQRDEARRLAERLGVEAGRATSGGRDDRERPHPGGVQAGQGGQGQGQRAAEGHGASRRLERQGEREADHRHGGDERGDQGREAHDPENGSRRRGVTGA
jgi:predicted DNA-binding transcriptional regulator YafY